MLALDLSFGARHVTPEWCQVRIAEGWQLLIADLVGPGSAAANLQVAYAWWERTGWYQWACAR